MKWTTEKPTKPGWYWVKAGGLLSCMRLYTKPDGRTMLIGMSEHYDMHLLDDSFQWAGPIPEPTD